ncbi:hypothetical protein MHLP_03115 [Candidatus Mycoplasma haematolamae str. Purdue]|uniref:Uncharacterized protein n=1 Tax=Mycoplasma haematolamae (strain Purdue) TaxID=1212765 RepID=I7BK07_MYCHA|nr:hypothetical protein [Candidatus Mycoplasma haematolamae]AFO52203.1 hypothetical protein MHLP_03115 [Candidatus Mycoplasma haematolamae str. Purdue]
MLGSGKIAAILAVLGSSLGTGTFFLSKGSDVPTHKPEWRDPRVPFRSVNTEKKYLEEKEPDYFGYERAKRVRRVKRVGKKPSNENVGRRIRYEAIYVRKGKQGKAKPKAAKP